jgi:hypothetical protein
MKLTKQETATVLLALRYIQTVDESHRAAVFEDSAHFEGLKVPKNLDRHIDTLCERINMPEDGQLAVFRHVTDGGAIYLTDNHNFEKATLLIRIDGAPKILKSLYNLLEPAAS